MVRRISVCLLVGMFVGSIICLADSSGCGCNASATARDGEKGTGDKNDGELRASDEEAQEGMEWQCIFAGFPCLDTCPWICRNTVLWCEYCETKVTSVTSCGWVFTE